MKNITLVFLTILTVFSCSDTDDGTNTEQTEVTLIGKWYLLQKGSYENPIVYDYEDMEKSCEESGLSYYEPIFIIFTDEGDYTDGGGCLGGSNNDMRYSFDGKTISFFNKSSGSFHVSAEVMELTSDKLIIEFNGGDYHEEYKRA